MATPSVNSAAQAGSRPVVNGTGHQQRSGDLAGGPGQVGGFSSQNLNGIVSKTIFPKLFMIQISSYGHVCLMQCAFLTYTKIKRCFTHILKDVESGLS